MQSLPGIVIGGWESGGLVGEGCEGEVTHPPPIYCKKEIKCKEKNEGELGEAHRWREMELVELKQSD